jgi:hypothetical protein
MLSLPPQHTSTSPTPVAHIVPNPEPTVNKGIWGHITPKRSQALTQCECDVAQHEYEVALGARGNLPSGSPCPQCGSLCIITEFSPSPTAIKEVVKEADLAISSWMDNVHARAEDVFDCEISHHKDSVNRCEHDTSRHEAWITEQLA